MSTRSFAPLRSGLDIREVFQSRQGAHGALTALHVRPRPDGGPARAAVVAGRKVGGAVLRNRVKRRLRDALHRATPPAGYDIVVVGRSAAAAAPFEDLVEELRVLLARAIDRTDRANGAVA